MVGVFVRGPSRGWNGGGLFPGDMGYGGHDDCHVVGGYAFWSIGGVVYAGVCQERLVVECHTHQHQQFGGGS